MNLVSNAVKFTDKGFVRVRAEQDEKAYYLSVQDSGIGIDAKDIKGLFQKYHQVRSDRPGYGLGYQPPNRRSARRLAGSFVQAG